MKSLNQPISFAKPMDEEKDDEIIVIPRKMLIALVANQMKNIGKSQKEINETFQNQENKSEAS
jgi:hypothetical protein